MRFEFSCVSDQKSSASGDLGETGNTRWGERLCHPGPREGHSGLMMIRPEAKQPSVPGHQRAPPPVRSQGKLHTMQESERGSLRHGNAVLVAIGRTKIFLPTLYLSPYPIPPEFGILKDDRRFLCIKPIEPVVNGGL